MLRKSLLAVFTLVICVGMTLSEEIRGIITKVNGNNVTFTPIKGKKGNIEKGEPKTLPVASDVKILKGGKKGTEPTTLEGGLKAKMFSSISEKGVFATIVTSDDGKKITSITVRGGGGKKKKNQ